jgi:uncharacterized protein YecT (DUF1311 family)
MTPIANIAGITTLLASVKDPAAQQALRMAQRAWLQLDHQNPAPSVPAAHQEGAGESRSQVSGTHGGHPRPRRH